MDISKLSQSTKLKIAIFCGLILLSKLRGFFKKPYKFNKKNVLITGGGNGIGRLVALKLAKEGSQVIVWDLNEEWAKNVVKEIETAKGQARAYKVDLCDNEQVNKVAQQTLADVGYIDVLINNAGIVSGKRLLECSDAQIQRTFLVNSICHFWTVKNFLPSMLSRNEGHIVTIASNAGLVGVPRLVDYCASKFAAVGFDESLRRELQTMNVNVHTTCICPYYINTGMFDGVSKSAFFGLIRNLEPEYVANEIVSAIRWRKPFLSLPPLSNVAPFLKSVLPTYTLDVLFKITGLSRSMDEFTGRSQK
eukprot:c19500_g1_i1.p1 GENE.c19500_g1_i1~~c19500_g1_i1.p1  ORF type:complete len:306 (+),score=138.94 c19500_g1_i1:31-948(+)